MIHAHANVPPAIFLSPLVIAKRQDSDTSSGNQSCKRAERSQRNRWWLHDEPPEVTATAQKSERGIISNISGGRSGKGQGRVLWHSHMVFLWLSSGWLRMTSLRILCPSCLHVSVCVRIVCLVKPSAWHLEDHWYNEADPSKKTHIFHHIFLCSLSLSWTTASFGVSPSCDFKWFVTYFHIM